MPGKGRKRVEKDAGRELMGEEERKGKGEGKDKKGKGKGREFSHELLARRSGSEALMLRDICLSHVSVRTCELWQNG